MISGQSVSALIPARGGSRGFPGKNLARLGDKSLLAHAIVQAQAAKYVDEIIVSSDDDSILDEARRWNADVVLRRPHSLATDEASTDSVTMHVLDHLARDPDFIVLLQVTTPLRRSEDIDAAIALCDRSGAPACVSVTLAEKTPYWMYRLDSNHRLSPLLDDDPPARRQDAPPVFLLNGAIYVARTGAYRERGRFLMPDMVGHPMPPEHSVDIDSPEDLLVVQHKLAAKGG